MEDEDVTAEEWTDCKGNSLRPDRFWGETAETFIAADDEGPCMGIELNIWERAKVEIFSLLNLIHIIVSIIIVAFCVLYLL